MITPTPQADTKFVVLRQLEHYYGIAYQGFFTTYIEGHEYLHSSKGELWYELRGYVSTVEAAQKFLYGTQ